METNPEKMRLAEDTAGKVKWKFFGPYLSERQWGTVRGDYSAGGTAWDPAGQLGVTSLMATLLTDGAGTLTTQALRQRQEDAAASVGFSASLDRLGGRLRVLSANRLEGFGLLRQVTIEPVAARAGEWGCRRAARRRPGCGCGTAPARANST
mgnify:CR=1 FL=1